MNEEAKEKVMELCDIYKYDNIELSSNDVNNIIKKSLQDILSDSNIIVAYRFIHKSK